MLRIDAVCHVSSGRVPEIRCRRAVRSRPACNRSCARCGWTAGDPVHSSTRLKCLSRRQQPRRSRQESAHDSHFPRRRKAAAGFPAPSRQDSSCTRQSVYRPHCPSPCPHRDAGHRNQCALSRPHQPESQQVIIRRSRQQGRGFDQIRHARSLLPLNGSGGKALVATVAARRDLPEVSDGDLYTGSVKF
jgi:hypothetical protein